IIIIIILIKSIKNNIAGNTKRVKVSSFIYLPILILIYLFEIFRTTHSFPIYFYFIFIISAIIGGIAGFIRSKSYSFTINADGDVFYRKEVWDSVILIIFMTTEGLLRYIFDIYDNNLITLVVTALIILTTSSIVIRRVGMYLKFRDLKRKL
ncbi:MAG: hypothetical protein ACRCX8_18325, partial [Sarcina sp.]